MFHAKAQRSQRLNFAFFAPLREKSLPVFVVQVARGRLYSEMTCGSFSDTRNRGAEFVVMSRWLGKCSLQWRWGE